MFVRMRNYGGISKRFHNDLYIWGFHIKPWMSSSKMYDTRKHEWIITLADYVKIRGTNYYNDWHKKDLRTTGL